MIVPSLTIAADGPALDDRGTAAEARNALVGEEDGALACVELED